VSPVPHDHHAHFLGRAQRPLLFSAYRLTSRSSEPKVRRGGSEDCAVIVPRDTDKMLHLFQLIVFGFLALVVVIIVLIFIGGVLGSLLSGLRSSFYDESLRRSVPKTSCGHGPNDRIETLTGSGGYCRACEMERETERQRKAERDWEARKIELRRDHPPPPRQ